jgi:hypothetical protein
LGRAALYELSFHASNLVKLRRLSFIARFSANPNTIAQLPRPELQSGYFGIGVLFPAFPIEMQSSNISADRFQQIIEKMRDNMGVPVGERHPSSGEPAKKLGKPEA